MWFIFVLYLFLCCVIVFFLIRWCRLWFSNRFRMKARICICSSFLCDSLQFFPGQVFYHSFEVANRIFFLREIDHFSLSIIPFFSLDVIDNVLTRRGDGLLRIQTIFQIHCISWKYHCHSTNIKRTITNHRFIIKYCSHGSGSTRSAWFFPYFWFEIPANRLFGVD